MLRILSLATLLLSTAAFAAAPEMANGYGSIDAARNTDPVALAERFCDARITGDMAPLVPFFAPKLAKLLDEHAHSHLAAAVPWQGYIYHPTGCAVEVLNGFDDTVGVLVKITYSSAERSWSDTLNLERTPDSWWINNVFYEQGGNLRFTLFHWLDS
jgi:hypothetical protein